METEKEYGHCLVCDNCVRTTWQPHEFADVPRLSTVARCPSPVARRVASVRAFRPKSVFIYRYLHTVRFVLC